MFSHINSTSKLTRVWSVLLLLTLSTFIIGYLKLSGLYVVSFILLTVAVKGILIIDHFMGLRHVRVFWRFAMLGFVTVIPIIILIGYYLSSAT